MLLREEIERSFGDGPEHQPIEELVVAGRRRVRRRQAVGVVAAFATAAVLATTYAVTAPGGGGTGGPQIASDPSPTPDADVTRETDPDTAVTSEMTMGSGAERVTLTEDGDLAAGGAVELLRKIDNPMELDPPSYSIAVDVRISGEHQWMFMVTGPDSGGGAGQPVREHPDQTFEEWVEDQVAAAEDDSGLDDDGVDVSPDSRGSDSGSTSGGGSNSGITGSGSGRRLIRVG